MLARSRTLLLVGALALAGCATPSATEEAPAGAFSIAREHVVDVMAIDPASLQNPENIEQVARSIGETTLVIRVGKPGAYALEYVDREGNPRVEHLADTKVGHPVRVGPVDPLADVRLRELTAGTPGAIVHERAAVDDAWWTVAGVPLGLRVPDGASAAYAYSMDLRAEFEQRDLVLPDGPDGPTGTLERGYFLLDAPLRGTLEWETRGDHYAVRVGAHLAQPTGDVARFELAGVDAEGQRGEIAVVMPPFEARAETGFSLFLDGDSVRAARFDGATASGGGAKLWGSAEGLFARDQVDERCPDGATHADPCLLYEGGTYDGEVPESALVDAPALPADAEARAEIESTIAPLLRVLAQDIVVGDSFRVHGATEFPATPGTPDADASFEYLLEVASVERLATPAGAFDALRITQTLRLAMSVAGAEGTPMPNGVSFDETVARTTIWLDAARHVPLRVEAESPMDVDKLVHDIVGAVDPAAWEGAGLPVPAPESYRIGASGRSVVEAERLEGEAKLAPYVGLLLGGALAQGAIPMAGLGAFGATLEGLGMGSGGEASTPAQWISLTSAGPLADGQKAYTIAAATSGMSWGDVKLTLDGVERRAVWSADCSDVFATGAVVCGDAEAARGMDVDAGDQLVLFGVVSGQTLRLIDADSDSVMLTLVVG